MQTILLFMEAFTAILFVGLSLPLMRGKIPPNNWYGVRVRKTLENEDLWYKANAAFGRDFLLASLIVLLACVALFFLKDGMTLNTFLIIISTVLVVPYAAAMIRSLMYLRNL